MGPVGHRAAQCTSGPRRERRPRVSLSSGGALHVGARRERGRWGPASPRTTLCMLGAWGGAWVPSALGRRGARWGLGAGPECRPPPGGPVPAGSWSSAGGPVAVHCAPSRAGVPGADAEDEDEDSAAGPGRLRRRPEPARNWDASRRMVGGPRCRVLRGPRERRGRGGGWEPGSAGIAAQGASGAETAEPGERGARRSRERRGRLPASGPRGSEGRRAGGSLRRGGAQVGGAQVGA